MSYDALVIGAGTNGLVAAATLARAGKRVVVVDRCDEAGGLAAGTEFHPGYRHAGILHDTSGVRASVVKELELEQHGLKLRERAPHTFGPAADGGAWAHPDPAYCADSLGPDAPAYRAYRDFLARAGKFLASQLDAPPIDPEVSGVGGLVKVARTGLSLRRLGRDDMVELTRVLPMCVADWMNEQFEHDRLKAMLCWPALEACYGGPWSSGTAALMMMKEAVGGPGVVGGSAAYARALESACRDAGVDFRMGFPVRRVHVSDGRVVGARLSDGSEIPAWQVFGACDPKHLFQQLFDPGDLPTQLEDRIRVYRVRGTTAKVHLALLAAPQWLGAGDRTPEHVRTGGHVDDLERAFDAVKYHQCSETPILDVSIPTLEDASLAPDGHHVLSVLAQHAPYHLEGGWSDAARDEFGQRVLRVLEEAAPGIGKLVVGMEVLTPADLEERFGLSGGHLLHGEPGLDQLLSLRPMPECAQYATPVQGLYLCGSGVHPGGGITGMPGALAARTSLKRRRPTRT